MRSATGTRLVLLTVFICALVAFPAPAQTNTKRLILKDGSYQIATKWEVKGERVRYYSAERGDWEEVPNSMVDWAATEKYLQDRASGKPLAQNLVLNKEDEADEKGEALKSPSVAPGLRLPGDGGIWLLDNYGSQPQLVELPQSDGEVNRNTKRNILRAAINPVAGSKQTIELKGLHAGVSAHATLPSIYISVAQDDPSSASNADSQSEKQTSDKTSKEQALPWDRFRIVKLQSKQDKRIVGDVKIAIYGKTSQQQDLVATTTEKLTGDWMKLTPTNNLASGEYAVVEVLGKEGINLYVWDFRVDPDAPANQLVVKPDSSEVNPETPKLENRFAQPSTQPMPIVSASS